MLGGVMVRERTCPACAVTVRAREARWCGSCGELLEPPAATPEPALSPRVRRFLSGGAGAVVVAVLLVLIGDVVDRGRSATVRDLLVARPEASVLERVERRRPGPPPVITEPTCIRRGDHACFLWTVEADGAGFDVATAAGDLLVSEQALDGLLVARSLTDGSVVWTVELARGFSGGVLHADGDVIIHVDGGDLTVRDPATGEERWRTDQLGRFAPYQIHRSGDVLVVAGESRRATSQDGGPPHAVIAGLDPTTGAVEWMQEPRTASLAADGVTVVTTRDGHVRAYEPTGELRWQADEPRDGDGNGEAWAAGHAVTIYRDDVGPRLHRLLDGAPLGDEGSVIVTDDVHTLAEVYGGAPAYVLLDTRGEVWRVEEPDWGQGCLSSASLEATTVEITPCGGGRVTLDRADGTELARIDPPTTRADAFGGRRFGRVGPYELSNADFEAQAGEVIVTDTRTGEEIARLPPDTHPVWRDHAWQDGDLGGVIVLQSRFWLSALPLPERAWVGGARTQ